MTARNKSAFTLLELIIVIAILVVLILFLLPSLPHHTPNYTAATMSNMRQISVACIMYAHENADTCPPHLGTIMNVYLPNPRPLYDQRIHPAPPPPLPKDTDLPTCIAYVDAHCDFFYAGAGVHLKDLADPSHTILLYDKPILGKLRLVTLADGHAESVEPYKLRPFVEATNFARIAQHLQPLPNDLASGPLTLEPTTTP